MDDIAETAPAATLGKRLRAAREAAGLSVADVAARTKIRPGILNAFEADDHAQMPALTYALGFAKAYARTVGLDPEDISETYRRESGARAPVPIEASLQPIDERRLPTPRVVAGATAAAVLGIGLLWAWGAGWLDRPIAEPPAAVRTATRPQAAGPAPASAPTPPVAANAPVVLTATDDVWMRISDRQSGTAAFNGTLARGQSFQLPPAQGGWLLRTGRAGALAITVGARRIPPLGGPAEGVRNLPLDPQALLARAAPPAPPAPGTPT